MIRRMSRYSRPHVIRLCGLALSFVGTVALAATTYYGQAAGWGGKIVWTSTLLNIAWYLGWPFLAIGFVLQFIGDLGHARATNASASTVNPLARLSNDELVAEHCKSGWNSHFLSEMTRRLMRSNQRLSKWLLVFIVAIFLLTGVLAWTALREMLR